MVPDPVVPARNRSRLGHFLNAIFRPLRFDNHFSGVILEMFAVLRQSVVHWLTGRLGDCAFRLGLRHDLVHKSSWLQMHGQKAFLLWQVDQCWAFDSYLNRRLRLPGKHGHQ